MAAVSAGYISRPGRLRMDKSAEMSINVMVEGPLRVETTDDCLSISVGRRVWNGMSFTDEYIVANKEEFTKLVEWISVIIQDSEQEGI